MAIPDYQAFMLPILKHLQDGEEHPGSQLVAAVADEFLLTEEERNRTLPSGGDTYVRNRYGWARTYLKKAGLITYPRRGTIQLTERGKEVVRSNPPAVDNNFLLRFQEFVDFKTKRRDSGTEVADTPGEVASADSSQTPEEALDAAYERLRGDLEAELLDQVRDTSPAFFERLVVELLVGMGYGGSRVDAGRAIGRSGDEGIDGIIKEDRLGLDAIYLQAKRWANPVGRPEIQKFAGALQGHRARKGVFITTSSFTREALDYVDRIESRIVLIDGEQLAALMVDHGVGVTRVGVYEVKRVDGDYFVES